MTTTLPLTVLAQTSLKITVGWTPPAGVYAYRFFRDGTPVSSSWKPAQYLQPDGTAKTSFAVPDGNTHTFSVVAVSATAQGWVTVPTPAPPPVSNPVKTWVAPGDFGDGWEYGGTFDGTPPLAQRVQAGPGPIDGITRPAAALAMFRIEVDPGDAYGGSSGWRTLGHVYEPSKFTFGQGDVAWFVWSMLCPAGYPGDANMFVSPFEMHQTKAAGVTVTGPAPFNFCANGSKLDIHVKGGVDGQGGAGWTTKIDTTFPMETGKWQAYAVGFLFDPSTGGWFELLQGVPGAEPQTLLARQGIGTMYQGSRLYPLFGLYRAQSGTSRTVVYTSDLQQFADRDGAVARLKQLAG